MGTIILQKPELLYITGENGTRPIGGNQYWYPKGDFFPKGACAATTASNILAYMLRTRPELLSRAKAAGLDGLAGNKAEYLEFMKKVYPYFTPSIIGVHGAGFIKGMTRLSDEYGLSVSVERLKVPIMRSRRPGFNETAVFIRDAISAEIPVAFLVLSNGGIKNIYNWHWMTIIGLDEESRTAKILDNTMVSWAEFGTWLEKSMLGGTFLRIMDR